VKLSLPLPILADQPLHVRFLPIAREARLAWSFVAGDISSAIVPALLFTLAAWRSSGAPLDQLLSVVGRSLLYFSLYLYSFCLANQATGLEEDQKNKRHRPLVRGVITVRGAWQRWVVVMALLTLVSVWLGIKEYALAWQVIILVHNVMRGARSWFVKNLSMALGVVTQLAAAWQIVTPLTPTAWRWVIAPALLIFPLISVQDLRDMEGDRASGRRTLPLVLGERLTRATLSVCFGLLPLALHYALMRPAGARPTVVVAEIVLSAVTLWIAARIALRRSPREDHHTYILFTYWYCLLLMSALIVL
jgi:4-hydroxybenzoate polyprenyltransferase